MDGAAMPIRRWLGVRVLHGDSEGDDRFASLFGSDFPVGNGSWGKRNGFGGEVDGGMHAVEIDELPHVVPEGFRTPVNVVAGGFAGGEVAGVEVVVNEADGDGLFGGDGLGEEAAAERERWDVAYSSGALGKEDYGQTVTKTFGHAFGSLGSATAGATRNVNRAGHEADPAKDRGFAELDLGDEDAGTHGGVQKDIDVGEVV